MSDLIRREQAMEAMRILEAEDNETYGCSIPECFDSDRAVEALKKLPSAEQEEFEWCTDCKEYDQDKHCCHRWTKVIRDTVEDMKNRWQWTPVTEALPEEETEVLVTVRFDGTKDVKPSVYIETASQISGEWTSYSDEWKVAKSKHHVIAWMPLPEPWKG